MSWGRRIKKMCCCFSMFLRFFQVRYLFSSVATTAQINCNYIHNYCNLVSNFILGNAQEHLNFPIVYCSDGFSALTGYSRAEIMGQSCNCSFLYGLSTDCAEAVKINDSLVNCMEMKTEILLHKKSGK